MVLLLKTRKEKSVLVLGTICQLYCECVYTFFFYMRMYINKSTYESFFVYAYVFLIGIFKIIDFIKYNGLLDDKK